MNKYNNACVYKIYNKLNPEEFYIGSTIQSLTRRFQYHKYISKNSLFHIMKEKGFDNFDIELVCCYEDCESRTDLLKFEQEVMDELKPTINKNRAHNNEKDTIKSVANYHIKHRDQILLRHKLYREHNKDSIKEKSKEVYKCECGKKLTKSKKSRHEKSNFHQDFINNQ